MNKFLGLLIFMGLFFSCEKDDSSPETITYPNLYPIEENNLWGYINSSGQIMIEPQYEYAGNFYNGKSSIMKNGEYGFINEKGDIVIEPKFQMANPFSKENLAAVKKDNKYGYINQNGDVVIDFEYDFSWGFGNGFAVVQNNAKYGIINQNGEIIVPIIYDNANGFSDDFAFIALGDRDNQLWAIVNNQGTLITDFIFSACVYKEEYPGGSSTYTAYPYFSEGLAAVNFDGKNCIINTNGAVVLETDYSFLYTFREGLAYACKNNVFGFINKDGEMVIEPAYYGHSSSFKNGLAPVKNADDRYGMIDKNNNAVIPFEYKICSNFYGDLASVYFTDNSKGYIDINNKIIWKGDVPVTPTTDQNNPELLRENDLNQMFSERQIIHVKHTKRY